MCVCVQQPSQWGEQQCWVRSQLCGKVIVLWGDKFQPFVRWKPPALFQRTPKKSTKSCRKPRFITALISWGDPTALSPPGRQAAPSRGGHEGTVTCGGRGPGAGWAWPRGPRKVTWPGARGRGRLVLVRAGPVSGRGGGAYHGECGVGGAGRWWLWGVCRGARRGAYHGECGAGGAAPIRHRLRRRRPGQGGASSLPPSFKPKDLGGY